MEDKFILFVLAILVLAFESGNLERIEYSFIAKIEEAAQLLEIENGFSEDSRLIQEESNKATLYKHLPTEKNGSVVFRRKASDAGKNVIVLDREEDRLNLKQSLEKRIFVVLKKNPAEKNQYFVLYSYIRNAFADEKEGVTEISGERYKIEWDIWDHRGSKNLAVLFGWTTCSRSLLISCKMSDPKTSSKSKAIILSEPDSASSDYSEEKDEEEEEEESDSPSGRTIKKAVKSSPLSNFYPSIDYDELQTAFYLKTIKLATLSEGILLALRPSLKRIIKKYTSDVELGQQTGTPPEPKDDDPPAAGKMLKRPRGVLSVGLGKGLDALTAGFPDIGALSQGTLTTNAETTADMFVTGSDVLGELWTTSTLKGDQVFRINPNPAILLKTEITMALTAKPGKGPVPVLSEIYPGGSSDSDSPTPLSKLVDLKAANILIDNILPTFTTNDFKIKTKTKKVKKDKSLAILEALRPASFSILRLKRQNPVPPADPGTDPNQKLEALKAELLARAKAQQQEALAKGTGGDPLASSTPATIPTKPPQGSQAEQLDKIRALLMARAEKMKAEAAANANTTPPPKMSSAGATDKPKNSEDKKFNPLDMVGQMSKVIMPKKAKKKSDDDDDSGGGGIIGGVVGGFGGLFGKRSIAENSEKIHDGHGHYSKREAAPAPHPSKFQTRNDVFSNLGWTTQQDLGSFSSEASYLLNSGTFAGWGPCKISTDVSLAEIKKAENVEKIVELLTELMKTRCDSRVSERVADLISEKWIEMTNEKAIVFGPKALEVLGKPKLEVVEAEKLSMTFELAVFSKTILKDLKNFSNVATSPVTSHAAISKNSFVLMHFALNAMNMARYTCQKHYVMLTRNTMLTVQTAIARVITDIIKISYQPVLSQGKLVKSLRKKSANNLYNLIGLFHFYLRGSLSSPEGDVMDDFKTFMESNSKSVLKSTEHFTSKIKGVTKNADEE